MEEDWSIHFIPPVDFKDFVLGKDLEGNELLGAKAHAAVSTQFFLYCGSFLTLHIIHVLFLYYVF